MSSLEIEQLLVDLLGRHVARRAVLEDLQDLEPRQRDLEPRLAQVLTFHDAPRSAWLDADSHGMIAAYGIIRQKTGLRQARSITDPGRCGLLTTAASYRMPIQQGNYLDPAAIAQVKPGMTHSQVRYLLGTPMVPGAFDNARWDYDYYLKTRHLQTPERGHVAVYFTNDLVARVDSNVKQRAVCTRSLPRAHGDAQFLIKPAAVPARRRHWAAPSAAAARPARHALPALGERPADRS